MVYASAFEIDSKRANDLYNGACAASLSGDNKIAIEWIEKAIDNGWKNITHLKKDTDLLSLHSLKEWDLLVDKLQKKIDLIEQNYDKPLQTELLQIREEDQKYRTQISETEKKYGSNSKEVQDLWATIRTVDSVNLEKVKKILDKHGWVGPDKVGDVANNALFLVIQHSDIKDQKKYLPMMRIAVKEKKANSSSLALLEDRVALREGKKQIYGSQIGRDDVTGKRYVLPLEDPDNVDKRRAEVGLMQPLAEYVKYWGIVWDVEEYKKTLSNK